MPAPYTIRRVRVRDMEKILEIERASFGREAWDRKLFAEYARSCGALFLLAERDGIIDGYSIACVAKGRAPRPGKLASLESIAVLPRARGRGAASSLLQSTIRRIKLQGASRMTLMVRKSNAVAIGFYERRGFAPVRRAPAYYEDGEEGLLMRKDLTL